jgi:hypothetical protein
MGKDISQFTALLGKRLQALQSLAHEISAGQAACVALDIESLEAHDREKQRLCAEVRRIDIEVMYFQQNGVPLWQRLAEEPSGSPKDRSEPDSLRQMRRLWEESETARAEVRKRNEVYAEFLRRARSTASVMANVMSHCLGVYPSGILGSSANLPFERSF